MNSVTEATQEPCAFVPNREDEQLRKKLLMDVERLFCSVLKSSLVPWEFRDLQARIQTITWHSMQSHQDFTGQQGQVRQGLERSVDSLSTLAARLSMPSSTSFSLVDRLEKRLGQENSEKHHSLSHSVVKAVGSNVVPRLPHHMHRSGHVASVRLGVITSNGSPQVLSDLTAEVIVTRFITGPIYGGMEACSLFAQVTPNVREFAEKIMEKGLGSEERKLLSSYGDCSISHQGIALLLHAVTEVLEPIGHVTHAAMDALSKGLQAGIVHVGQQGEYVQQERNYQLSPESAQLSLDLLKRCFHALQDNSDYRQEERAYGMVLKKPDEHNC